MDERKHFFDDPGNVKKVLRVFYVICAALLLADFVIHRHVYHELEGLWGSTPATGSSPASCWC